MPITGLDHVLVGVADLESARATWQGLGFTLTPRGRHIGWGTANYCIMFEQDYIELLGIVDDSQFVNRLDEFLAAEGEGLLGLAFATEDAEQAYQDLTASGISAEPAKQLKRLLELPDGTVTPEFALVHIDRTDTAGLRAFVCSHLTREMVWQPQWLRHANGAEAITAIEISAADPKTTAGRLGRLTGRTPVDDTDGFSITLPGDACTLTVTPGEKAEPLLAGMSVMVPTLDLPAGHFAAGGIYFSRDTFTVSVDPADANGVALNFTLANAPA
ncbi:MAG: VOC family protein [Rhodospirillales bacterium]